MDFSVQLQQAKALHQANRFAEAEVLYRELLSREPKHAEALHFLGLLLDQTRRHAEAISLLERAVELSPGVVHFLNNLGNALRHQGRVDEAIAAFEKALLLRPDYAVGHHNLSLLLAGRGPGQMDDAILHARRAVELDPNLVAAHDHLATLLVSRRQLDEAAVHRERALGLSPGQAAYHFNHGNLLREQGHIDRAIAAYRRALELNPGLVAAHNSLLYSLNFSSAYDSAAVKREHAVFAERHETPLLAATAADGHEHDRDSRRRLRVGYVSPDFRQHPVGAHLLAILSHHDPEQFEVCCYSDVAPGRADAVTERFRALGHMWRETHGRSDAELAALVRGDGIDILIDCTLHMAGSRLLAFARKPAPVQVTHFGYPGTTGLRAMDYRISDPFLDPVGEDVHYPEKTLRLEHSFWCYNPLVDVEPAAAPPSRKTGRITFGCLNSFAKVSDAAVELYARVMEEVSGSRMILLAAEGSHLERVRAIFTARNVSAERVRFVDTLPPAEYLRLYNEIDVVLDCFPYTGHTTSLDALYMGVPVVTFAPKEKYTCAARAGRSILSNLQMPKLIAESEERYVELAKGLAEDRGRLAAYRRTLRERMRGNVLMDAVRATRDLEGLYRRAWVRWCGSGEGGGPPEVHPAL